MSRLRLLLLVLLALIGAGAFFIGEMTDNSRTAAAAVRVLEVNRRLDGRPDIRFSFEANGTRYEATDTAWKRYEQGDAIKACYDPQNPLDVSLALADANCG